MGAQGFLVLQEKRIIVMECVDQYYEIGAAISGVTQDAPDERRRSSHDRYFTAYRSGVQGARKPPA
jgi:hypothetical protein